MNYRKNCNWMYSVIITALFFIAGTTNAQIKKSNFPESLFSTYYHQRLSHFETLPKTKNDIVFLGNSISDGAEWSELFADKIDPVVRRSTDKGKTWSEPLVIANYGALNGVGDAALVMDKSTGDLLCLLSADRGFFQSTHNNPAKVLIIRSTDNGISWGTPLDITNQIYGPNPKWKGLFVASGRAHQLRDGKIVAAIAVREEIDGKDHINNYMISSDDHGATWSASTYRVELNGDESKIVELNNGDLLMSIRNKGLRRFNTSSDKGKTWKTAYSQTDLPDPNCDGDIIRYTSTIDGFDKNRLLHTIPFAADRNNVSVLLSTDEGATWPIRKTIFPGSSAYSSITVLPDGTLGIYYENGENSIYQMYFVRFSLNWLSNGTDSFTPN